MGERERAMAAGPEPSPRALAFAGSPELLHVAAVRSSKEKVDRVEFHPVQPWLCFVDRGSNVSVWNYESDEVRRGSTRSRGLAPRAAAAAQPTGRCRSRCWLCHHAHTHSRPPCATQPNAAAV